jgi:phosphoribosylanthranilate isomerase
MSRTRVKICGITNVKDALLAVQYGTDAIGLNFYSKSARHISIIKAQEIVFVLPPFVTVAALFVNPTHDEVSSILNEVNISLLQFHGEETHDFCRSFRKPYIKAISVEPDLDLKKCAEQYTDAQAILLDTSHAGKFGGTGKVFNWKLIPENFYKPIILAGGLNSDNVADAILQVNPYAVDVTTGVESEAGKKDPLKLSRFFEKVFHANHIKKTD